MDLDLEDWLQRLYALGETDQGRRSVLGALLPTGGVLVDVGANIGLYTCTMAAHVGASGHVFAFEPMGGCVDALRRNIELNDLDNVTVLPLALSDQAKRVTLFAPPGDRRRSSGNTSLLNSGDGRPAGSADAVRLDDVFVGDRLDAIKLDVEGYEPEVLRGAVDTLHRFRPIVQCEVASPGVLDVALELARDLRLTPWVESRGRITPFRRGVWTNDLFLVPSERRT